MLHELRATPRTCFWGFFDAALPPVLQRALRRPRSHRDAHASGRRRAGPHDGRGRRSGLRRHSDRTARSRRARHDRAHPRRGRRARRHARGPRALDGAAAGLRHQHRGVVGASLRRFRQGANHHLPDRSPFGAGPRRLRVRLHDHAALRAARASSCRPDAGARQPALANVVVPLRPHFGVGGVAPREPGRINSIPPGEFGGNIDNWRFGPGAAMYYPVFQPGALCYLGDPHMAEGDGELSGTAIEASANALVQLTVHKGLSFSSPMLETADPLDRARVRRGSRSGDEGGGARAARLPRRAARVSAATTPTR